MSTGQSEWLTDDDLVLLITTHQTESDSFDGYWKSSKKNDTLWGQSAKGLRELQSRRLADTAVKNLATAAKGVCAAVFIHENEGLTYEAACELRRALTAYSESGGEGA